jgi:RNA polymerase sigma factor (sigma-70 family)
VSSGRAGSFEDLFRDQYPHVLREAVFVLNDRDLAKEVVNEAFTRLYTRWRRVSRYDKPGAWVRRVAIRLAVRRLERRGREVPHEETATWDEPGGAEDVRSAVRQLAPQQRAAVMLHYFDDLPLAEVARVLGCREGTVKAHLHQARARLAPLLVSVLED